MKKTIIRGGLETLYFSGLYEAMRPLVGGVGAILTLHRVRPARPEAFQPNQLLEITPEFFERLLRRLRDERVDFISLDEMHRRMIAGEFKRRFACVTFDDGYKDLLPHAYPLLRKYQAPFAVYIPTSFPDRIGELWWVALEAVIAQNDRIGLVVNGKDRFFNCATVADKRELFDEVYRYLRSMKDEDELRGVVRNLCAFHGIDPLSFSRDLCMSWEEIARLADDPLCTIGAHTVNHLMLRKLADDSVVRAEMEMSRAVLEAALGRRPQHLAYPVGDPTSAGPREFRIAAELGFKTAVTTRPGVLFKAHRDHMTALPRISINGEFQRPRYLKVLMSGAATAMWNGFRRVNAA
ncbi:MAG TPA: polysaccharide deacetylase family protein [Pseudolabrys sp.]|nr:polysaccharide deacetylase family protein [Pseudolabrys sp.]